MCWSGEASTVLAIIGLSSTAWAAYKKESPALWGCLGYFSLMELLQAYTYTVIDQCDLPSNQIATLLGYLHIAFQPFFINGIMMYFIPDRIRLKIQGPVYFLCFVSTIYMILQLYPFDWAGPCLDGRALCAPRLCSVSGNWHIAWDIPINGIGDKLRYSAIWFVFTSYSSYFIMAFIVPLLYGSWRMVLYTYVMGPFLAGLLTSNVNERPAVWCLLSIGFLLIVVKTPVRRIMFVKHWFLWPKEKKTPL